MVIREIQPAGIDRHKILSPAKLMEGGLGQDQPDRIVAQNNTVFRQTAYHQGRIIAQQRSVAHANLSQVFKNQPRWHDQQQRRNETDRGVVKQLRWERRPHRGQFSEYQQKISAKITYAESAQIVKTEERI